MAYRGLWARAYRCLAGCLAVLVLAALLPLAAAAQSTGATVSGTITDPTGASVPGATITATNTGTGAVRTATTDAKGFYNIANLQPGAYNLTYSANGFVTNAEKGLTLTVGQQLSLNQSLKVGSATQTVEVTGAAPAVQLASSTISNTVTSETMRELPLNGRSWTDLATLQPGVANPQDQPPFNGGRGQRGFGNQISITGRRPQDNNYRIDGFSVEDYMNGGPGNVQGGALGVDAVQEFSVLTGTYPAEYGMATGGVVNAITRSGTNQFHGSAYEFLRNNRLDANDFFANAAGQPRQPFHQNEFGASAGGPIVKNHTFVFGDYEGLRQTEALTINSETPTATARTGNLTTGAVTPDPYSQSFLNAFFPLPNVSGSTKGDVGTFSFPGSQVNSENFFIGRLDQHFSNADTLSGTLQWDKNNLNSPDEFNNKRATYGVQHELYGLQETHVFSPSLLNTVRVGLYRTPAQVGTTTGVTSVASDPKWGSVPGLFAPDVKIGGTTEFTGGVGAPSFYNFHYNTIQFYDDLYDTVGNHGLKFGFMAYRIRDNLTAVTDGNGVYSYGSLAAFLTNSAPNNFTALQSGGTITGRSIRQTVLGGYAQDDWRFSPTLTVNLGMRYEWASIPTETHGDLSILPTLSSPLPRCERAIAGCGSTGPYYLSNPTKYDFAPRLGMSWDPTGHGTTAIRAGFGVYDILPLPYISNLEYVFTAPFFKLGVTNAPPAGSFEPSSNPNDAYFGIAATSKTLRQAWQDQYPKRAYVLQYDLNLQHQFSNSLSATLGYIGSGGVHEPFRTEEANGVVPTDPNVLVWPTGSTNNDRVNPNAGVIRGLLWEGKSNYNALEAQLNKHMANGLQLSASYTWSHDIDDGTSAVAGDTFANSIPGLLWFNTHAERGNSDLNVGQSFVLNGIWQAPRGQSMPTLARFVAGGWQLGGLLRASSGVPFTLTIAGDPLGQFSSHPWDVPNVNPGCSLYSPGNIQYVNLNCLSMPGTVNPTTGQDPVRGSAGRNAFTGPNQYDVDLSLVKNFGLKFITEASNLQFRVEAFNLFNHPDFNPPVDNTDVFHVTQDKGTGLWSSSSIASGGLIDSLATPTRQIQLALKLTW